MTTLPRQWVCVRAGEQTPLRLCDSSSSYDLREARSVGLALGGGEHFNMVTIDDDGCVIAPALEPGRHLAQFRIEWDEKLIQYVPTRPMFIIALEDE